MQTIESVKGLVNMAPDGASGDSLKVYALPDKLPDNQNVPLVRLLERLKSMRDGRVLDEYLCWFFQIDR